MAMTVEQQRAVAMANARRRATEAGAHSPEQSRQVSPLEASSVGIASGLTFNFADELMAGAMTPIELGIGAVTGQDEGKGLFDRVGDAYGRALDKNRGHEAAAREQNPVASTVGDIAGGLVTGGGLASSGATLLGRTAGQGIGKRIGAGALEGAAYGGAYGFGSGEGVVDRAKGAGYGAVVGGGIGGAIPGVAAGVKAATTPIRNVYGSIRNPERAASQKVLEALGRDQAGDAVNRVGRADMTVADMAGDSTRGLLRASTTMPGPGREKATRFLTERQLQQPDNVLESLRQNLADPETFSREVARVNASRERLAAPVYQQAFKSRKPVDVSGVVKYIDDELMPGQSGLASPQADLRPDSASAVIGRIRSFFATNRNQRFDLQALHNVKGDLDDMIGAAKRAGEGNKTRMLMGVKRRLLQAMDSANPDYREARRRFAGSFDMEQAIEEGMSFDRMAPRDIRESMSRLTPSEREMFQVGVSRKLADQIANTRDGLSVVRRVFGSQGQQDRLKAAFGDGAKFRQFRADMIREARKEQTNRFVQGGSNTANKLAELEDAGFDPGIATAVARGDVSGAVIQAISRWFSRARGLNPEVAARVVDILTETDPDLLRKAFEPINAEAARQLSRSNLAAVARQALTRTGANLLGSERSSQPALQTP